MDRAKCTTLIGHFRAVSKKCSAFDMEMIFHSYANKTHCHKKAFALGLILKVTVFGTRKWPIKVSQFKLDETKKYI